jgi:hypothetical protein
MTARPLLLALALATAGGAAAQSGGWMPDLLTEAGQAEHYLPDFSYAGYRWGEQPIPSDFPDHTVIEAEAFGAVAGDDEDDTAAFHAALAEAHATDGPVLVRLPAGRLILTDILWIERSDLVLQGAGSGEQGTTLYMPEPLSSLPTPAPMEELEAYLLENDKRQRERDRGIDEPYSLYAWSGGYIWTNTPGGRGKPYLYRYDREPTTLATGLTGTRGSHTITAENGADLEPGQITVVNWFNREGRESSLLDYLYAGHADELPVGERHWESPDVPLTRQEVTVLAVEGDRVTIKEPLLHDLRPEWTPTMTAWAPITEVGIEGIRFEFLYNEYNVHHVEAGNNAVYLTNTAHSWVRDVAVVNGDSGILTDVCSNVTIDGVEVYGRKYHYGVHMGDCYNVLARDVYVAAPVVHTFTFNTGSRMCVYTASSATGTPVLDQHSGLNYQNLFDALTLYVDDPAHQPIEGGGAGYWKPSHAAHPVFWNVDFQFLYPDREGTFELEGLEDGPAARLVGLHGNRPLSLSYGPDPYVEGLNRDDLAVPSLYEHQLRQRLGDRAEAR